MIRARYSGFILVPVAVAIALIGVLAYFIASQSAINVNLVNREIEASQADYVVQAGLQHGLRHAARQGCGPYTNLVNTALGGHQYTTSLTTDLGSTTAYTVDTDQDTWIRSDMPDDNMGSDWQLHIRYEAGTIARPMYKYDLSVIPANASILSATAWFYVNVQHAEGPVDIHLLNSDWQDTTATWNTMGDRMDPTVIATIPAQPAKFVWVHVNLTRQVQAWVNGQSNYGIALNSTSEGTHAEYIGEEDSTYESYINVVVGTPPSPNGQLKAVGTLASGVSRTLWRDVVLTQAPTYFTHLSLGPGSGRDAWADSFYTTRNYGNDSLDIDSSGTLEHAFLKFDSLGVPVGARILSASLELYHTVTDGSPDNPGADVHRITRNWLEGTGSGSNSGDGVTWNTWDGSNDWTQGGGDFDAMPAASTSISVTVNDWENWNVRDLVQGWVDGTYPNHGLLLKATGTIEATFASKEDADPALRPRLTVTYTCACGTACAPLQGTGNLLMVVVNPSALVEADQKAKDLFESWGYTVSVISESADQTTFDTAYAANDVVFVSETVNSNTLGSRLDSAPIGIVSQDGDYNADLGLATGSSLKVGDSVDIVDTDHYITRPFASGALQVYAADMEQLVIDSPPTGGQQVLAEIDGAGALVALEAGDLMEGGGTAAGRRVMLPLGTRYRFDWDHLNANGQLLVQRALEWGVGADKVSKGNVLLVVVNPGSLTAQEDAKKALMEGWDFTVNLIDESDSQASFDAAIALNDVAYIPQDITSSNLGTKLSEAPIGVVNEEGEQVDELGFSGDKLFKTRREIDLIDTSHYITQPFSPGLLQFASSDQSVHMLSAATAPGLQTLGQSFNTGTLWEPSLATLDPGDDLWGGGTAAGRRVELPWGGDTFDINQLTDDGRTIMQRALEWGAGTEDLDFSTELLFVVADPSALTGAETAKKSLIESWGYTVNLLDDADSVADFAAAFEVNAVIYVSGEVSDIAIGSKLIKAGLGIVNEQIALHDELLLSTGAGTNDFNNISVIDNAHYITQGINTGWHTIASSNQPLNALMGTLAPGMTNLAEVWISGANYDFGLAVVDTGGQLNDAESAAGRRVQLPWGAASFDFSALNANGQNLMRRAIEWAGGAEIDLSPVAHWKLDETGGNTFIDSAGGHDATFPNPLFVSGQIDGGVDVPGINNAGSAPHADELNLTGGLTLMGWVNPSVLSGYDTLIAKASSGSDINYFLGTWEDEAVFGFSTDTDNWQGFYTSGANLATGSWVHLAASFSNNADQVVIYVDGSPFQSFATSLQPVTNAGAVWLGRSALNDEYLHGRMDDARIYNRVLAPSEVQDIYAASLPEPSLGYTEAMQGWDATSAGSWVVMDLAGLGVPPNAVVEVAVYNASVGSERWGGVRAVGSLLDRRFQLQEAEQGGIDSVTLHVQADANARIEYYSEAASDVSFALLGYWANASYLELFQAMSAASSGSWAVEDVSDDGLGPNQVAEIVISNNNQNAARIAGVRQTGSTSTRQFNHHEAEAGGNETMSMMVNTDASSRIELYAQDNSDIQFHVVGYWDAAPGNYVESGVGLWNPSSNNWENVNLAAAGVPADTVLQVGLANRNTKFERQMGVRSVGSGLDRVLDLHEAENGGSDLGSMHVNVDAGQNIQGFCESGDANNNFVPLGWWVLP